MYFPPSPSRKSSCHVPLERCHEINERKLKDIQCGFCPGRSTTDQIFTLQLIFEKPCEHANDICTCSVDLEKTYDKLQRDKLWEGLSEYGVDDRLLLGRLSLYSFSEVCVCVDYIATVHRGFWTPTMLCLSVVTTPVQSLHATDGQSQPSRRGCHCWRLQDQPFAFAEVLVLVASSQQGLQHAIDRFSAACDQAEMKMSPKQTEWRKSEQRD